MTSLRCYWLIDVLSEIFDSTENEFETDIVDS